MHEISLKNIIIISVSILIVCSCGNTTTKPEIDTQNKIHVEYPEAYELANIILALTKYGKTDKWEVRQGFDYYKKVQEYFKPVSNHALLDSVNYSRERWKEYLSFRTDSYAFTFNEQNRLNREIDFYTNPGVAPFDRHLNLVNDFIEKSNFRTFYSNNKSYYKRIIENYKKTHLLNEMRDFLVSHFGNQVSDNEYKVILSPFVYRMNCHRKIDSTKEGDFITIPNFVLSDTIESNLKNLARDLHNLFTEMNHAYVNPITRINKDLVTDSFDETIWDDDSGYANSNNAVFNEYMTWAVYDIFLQNYFPEHVKEIGLYWSFQNENRGFKYSHLFTQKLLELYNRNEGEKTITDLYPEFLQWVMKNQKDLSKPKINVPKDSLITTFNSKTKIHITFSESMKKVSNFTVLTRDNNNTSNTIEIKSNINAIKWSENGKQLEFNMNLPNSIEHISLAFNWWGTKNPLYSRKNILLERLSKIILVNKSS